MDELEVFCSRVLGSGSSAAEAAAVARQQAGADADRVDLLAAAVQACRERPVGENGTGAPGGVQTAWREEGLAGAVAAELQDASAQLPERQREALVLRELMRLSHEQIARALVFEPAAVAPLLARARLGLRANLRGSGPGPAADCEERDRALRCLTNRQDSEPLSAGDDDWLIAHLGSCQECSKAHAAMLEASVCYRVATRPRQRR